MSTAGYPCTGCARRWTPEVRGASSWRVEGTRYTCAWCLGREQRGEVGPRTYKRRNGVEKTRDGRWKARYHDEHGKPISRTFDAYKDARQWYEDQRASLRRGEHVAPRDGAVTFEEFAKEWLEVHDASQSTINAHETRLRVHVFPTFGSMALKAITDTDVKRWYTRGLSTLATNTRRAVLTSFAAVLTTAVQQRRITTNPAGPVVIKRKRAAAKPFKIWESEQVIRVRAGLPDQYRILATLGAGLGLRQGELFGLSPDDFDTDAGLVTVHRQVRVLAGGSRLLFAYPKGGEDHPIRQVPLPDSVAEAVEQHLREYPARLVSLPWETSTAKPVTVPLVVTSREGKALNKNYANGAIWKPALRSARVPETRDNGMHALRHFYASTLLDSGETIRAVAEYLGHADPGFTLRTYAHVMKRSHTRSQAAIDAVFAVATPEPVVSDLSLWRSQRG